MYSVRLNLYVLDPRPDYLPQLRRDLQGQVELEVISFTSGSQFMEYVAGRRFPAFELHFSIISYLLNSPTRLLPNGLQLLRQAREQARNLQCIVVSDHTELHHISEAKLAGAMASLTRSPNLTLELESTILGEVLRFRTLRSRQRVSRALRLLGLSALLLLFASTLYIYFGA